MSDDNVINFPDPEGLMVDVHLEGSADYDAMVVGVQTAVLSLCNGLHSTTDAEWEHIMDACVNMAVTAAMHCGMELEDIEDLFHSLVIEKVEYDA